MTIIGGRTVWFGGHGECETFFETENRGAGLRDLGASNVVEYNLFTPMRPMYL
jgi:hypothetical protein